jgi:hypothetical protein
MNFKKLRAEENERRIQYGYGNSPKNQIEILEMKSSMHQMKTSAESLSSRSDQFE